MDKAAPEAGIASNWAPVSRVMKELVPCWNGNPDEEVDATWWADYLAQVMGTNPLWGSRSVPPHDLFKDLGVPLLAFQNLRGLELKSLYS